MPCANRTTNTDTSYVRCPVLTNYFGKSTARVLQQLHYWLSHENLSYGIIHDNRQWIRNSYNQWYQQIKKTHQDLAIITIRRAFSELEKQGIVLSHCFDDHKNYMGGNQVKSYTIDYDRLESIIGDFKKTLISRPRSIQEQQSTSTIQTYNRAGDTSSFSIVSVHTNTQNACQKRASYPDQMSTPPDQMSTLLNRYISNKLSNKLSLFRAPRSIEQTQQRFGDAEIIQPDKPAAREEINFSKEMIDFWNEIVEENNPERKVSLNPKRSQNLNAAFKQFFESNLAKWEMFCQKITTCKFLMGEKVAFKASIDWAIRFETIQKIQEGSYTFGTRASNYTLKLNEAIRGAGDETLKAPFTEFVPSMQELSKAIAIRDSIKKKIDNAQYRSWFLPTEIVVEKNENGHDEATLCVPTRFMGERIKCQYSDIYEHYFSDIFVGSAEEYLQLKNTHPIVHNAQTLDITNEDQKRKKLDRVKNFCPVRLYNERGTSAVLFSKDNIQIDIATDLVDEKSSYIQKEMLSSSATIGASLEKIETASDICDHKESNLFKKDSCEKSDITHALIKTPACGDGIYLFNDEIMDQQEIGQTIAHDMCDRNHLSSCNNIKREEQNSDLIRGYSEDNRERSTDFSQKASSSRSVKPYYSALNDLKIIQIRKKIKKLTSDSLYMQWFHDATIFIEERRVFLHVSTHSIKQHIETHFQDILSNVFEAVQVVGEQSISCLPSLSLEEQEVNKHIIEPSHMVSASLLEINEQKKLSRQYDLYNEQKKLSRQYDLYVEDHDCSSVRQHKSEEPPDKLSVCKKSTDSTFDQFSALIDNVHCFGEKSRCHDPVKGSLNDTLSTQNVYQLNTIAYFDTSFSLLASEVVNDNDLTDLKKKIPYANKSPPLVHLRLEG